MPVWEIIVIVGVIAAAIVAWVLIGAIRAAICARAFTRLRAASNHHH